MTSQDRFSFEALAGGDEHLLQQARRLADRGHSEVRATLARVDAAYRNAADQASLDTAELRPWQEEALTAIRHRYPRHADTARANMLRGNQSTGQGRQRR